MPRLTERWLRRVWLLALVPPSPHSARLADWRSAAQQPAGEAQALRETPCEPRATD